VEVDFQFGAKNSSNTSNSIVVFGDVGMSREKRHVPRVSMSRVNETHNISVEFTTRSSHQLGFLVSSHKLKKYPFFAQHYYILDW